MIHVEMYFVVAVGVGRGREGVLKRLWYAIFCSRG